ncbi:Lysophospholipid acyltransferase 2 [Tupaia chinensis]|uniref:Lysophospholipid acyltransferase 2 n=1 Tax=Tupaia chinensis TaxID=246437 RepID=L9LBL9_TUPCH|nr:Lysophospholipid acyltransferase 2 [Tupaia chinensis]
MLSLPSVLHCLYEAKRSQTGRVGAVSDFLSLDLQVEADECVVSSTGSGHTVGVGLPGVLVEQLQRPVLAHLVSAPHRWRGVAGETTLGVTLMSSMGKCRAGSSQEQPRPLVLPGPLRSPVVLRKVNFVVCQLFALLAAVCFRTYLHSSETSSFIRHVVATLLGLYLALFCFGWYALHFLVQSGVSYCIMVLMGVESMHKPTPSRVRLCECAFADAGQFLSATAAVQEHSSTCGLAALGGAGREHFCPWEGCWAALACVRDHRGRNRCRYSFTVLREEVLLTSVLSVFRISALEVDTVDEHPRQCECRRGLGPVGLPLLCPTGVAEGWTDRPSVSTHESECGVLFVFTLANPGSSSP